MLKKKMLSMATLGICVLCFVACNPKKPTAEDFVGSWIEDGKDCQRTSSCGSIQFSEDGHFIATDIPEKYFGYVRGYSNSLMDGSGTWEFDSGGQPLEPYTIDLFFEASTENGSVWYHRTMYVSLGKEVILYSWVGDESERVSFKKDTSTSQTPAP